MTTEAATTGVTSTVDILADDRAWGQAANASNLAIFHMPRTDCVEIDCASIAGGGYSYRMASLWVFKMLDVQNFRSSTMIMAGSLLLPLITACNAGSPSPHAAIEKMIIERIDLPQGATNFDEYSQYFSKDDQGNIEAVFVRHELGQRDEVKEACVEMKWQEFPCTEKDFGIADAGRSKWVKDPYHFPVQSGGGCSFIHVKYSVRASKITSIECNGPY